MSDDWWTNPISDEATSLTSEQLFAAFKKMAEQPQGLLVEILHPDEYARRWAERTRGE